MQAGRQTYRPKAHGRMNRSNWLAQQAAAVAKELELESEFQEQCFEIAESIRFEKLDQVLRGRYGAHWIALRDDLPEDLLEGNPWDPYF